MKCYTGNDTDILKLYARAMVQAANLVGHIFVITEGDVWPAPMISAAFCWEPGQSLWATYVGSADRSLQLFTIHLF